MNEQIRQLLEQAKTESSQWFGSKPATTITYDELEKFAELIVGECADLLKKEAESSHDEGTETYNLLLKESKWMKKHFGVER